MKLFHSFIGAFAVFARTYEASTTVQMPLKPTGCSNALFDCPVQLHHVSVQGVPAQQGLLDTPMYL